MESYYVYIAGGPNDGLFVGMTRKLTDLQLNTLYGKQKNQDDADRLEEPKLLYFEHFSQKNKAINRKEDLYSWKTDKLLEMVEFVNPEWFNLAADRNALKYTLMKASY